MNDGNNFTNKHQNNEYIQNYETQKQFEVS